MDVEEYVYPMGEEVMPFSYKTHKTSRTGFVEDLEMKKFFEYFRTLLHWWRVEGTKELQKNDVKLLN